MNNHRITIDGFLLSVIFTSVFSGMIRNKEKEEKEEEEEDEEEVARVHPKKDNSGRVSSQWL